MFVILFMVLIQFQFNWIRQIVKNDSRIGTLSQEISTLSMSILNQIGFPSDILIVRKG